MNKMKQYEPLRSPAALTLYPGQIMKIAVPDTMQNTEMFVVSSGLQNKGQWIGAQFLPNIKGAIEVVNQTSEPVRPFQQPL